MEKSAESRSQQGGLNPTLPAPSYKPLLISVCLSAFLGPGAGQFYNRHWKKAILMALAALGLLIGLFLFFLSAAKAELQIMAETMPDMLGETGFETQLAQTLLTKNASQLSIFKWTFIALWCYSIVDAYLGAKKKMEKLNKVATVPQSGTSQ